MNSCFSANDVIIEGFIQLVYKTSNQLHALLLRYVAFTIGDAGSEKNQTLRTLQSVNRDGGKTTVQNGERRARDG